jgi:hypothetical protein
MVRRRFKRALSGPAPFVGRVVRPRATGPLQMDGAGPSPGTREARRSEFAVDVLDSDGRLLASFVCAVDAFRFAALLYEPGCCPALRRRSDGATRQFAATQAAGSALNWLEAGAGEGSK